MKQPWGLGRISVTGFQTIVDTPWALGTSLLRPYYNRTRTGERLARTSKSADRIIERPVISGG